MSQFGDIGVTEAQLDLLTAAERFCREQSPMSSVRALIETDLGYDADVWAEIGALGWLAIAVPEDFGGVGLSMTEVVPVMEQMGRYMLHSPFFATTLAAQAIVMGGTQAQKETHLAAIAGGAAATVALSEAGGNWDLTAISSTALMTDSGYRLSGEKTFVQDLEAARTIIISAKVDGAVQLFCLDADTIPAKAIRRERIIDDIKRSYALTLDGLVVPDTALMDGGKVTQTLEHIHLVANLLGAAEMTGAAQATIDYTVDYLKTRKQFGKLIGSFQALKHPTVDAYIDYEKSRSLLYAAAFSFGDQWPQNDKRSEIATRMAKAQSDKALSYAADRSIQFHGGFGFTYDCDAQLYRRRAIFNASQYGDAHYHKKKLAQLIL
ncbi:acyl-CoA dehydrogenase family protein [Fretibacter rubidus]|uniref:acyl-CoA dehydrogenase family protein n=1 Tax=Fretibacter rubidus TaxID=570162 RepID=UPI00352B0200